MKGKNGKISLNSFFQWKFFQVSQFFFFFHKYISFHFLKMQNDEVTILMIGDTGVGKSSFGNIYLEKPIFEASDSTDPVTLKADAQSNKINGCTRYAIDTVGFNDGQSIDSVQIQNLAILMRNYLRGVNGIVIVLNGMCDRFSQEIMTMKQKKTWFNSMDGFVHVVL